MKLAMYQAAIEADAVSADRILKVLEQATEPSAQAVGMFECAAGRFEVFALYAAPPPREILLRLLDAGDRRKVCSELRIEEIADADWVTLSQGQRGPVKAGCFFVHGSHDRDRAPSHRYVLKIDAGLAFGTAHHASTRGCLIALDDTLKETSPRRILDLGTGTGILAIAAAHATKRPILATDYDPMAANVAKTNVRTNCAWPSVRVLTADGFGHPWLRRSRSDLIFANLLARALYDLAPAMRRQLSRGGTAVLSGITEHQARAIEARYRAHGFVLKKRILLDGWTTLVLIRRH